MRSRALTFRGHFRHENDRITHDPHVLAGRVLRGLRISVAHVVNLVANGMTPAEIVAEHPDLEEADVREVLDYGDRYSMSLTRQKPNGPVTVSSTRIVSGAPEFFE
ncbi:MAG: DUF433 domain-containing protein, partial [Betaproteobacteria bacterium]